MGLKENLERLQQLTREADAAGWKDRLKKQRAQGRMTARERVEFLLDRGSFVEIDKFKTHRITDFDMAEKKIPGDGVVTGYGTIDGRRCASSATISRSSAAASRARSQIGRAS